MSRFACLLLAPAGWLVALAAYAHPEGHPHAHPHLDVFVVVLLAAVAAGLAAWGIRRVRRRRRPSGK